jgi:hypothetical protein
MNCATVLIFQKTDFGIHAGVYTPVVVPFYIDQV